MLVSYLYPTARQEQESDAAMQEIEEGSRKVCRLGSHGTTVSGTVKASKVLLRVSVTHSKSVLS